MELQNVPTKLVNKFNKANIKTVEDLQKNYSRLINGLGFGGIFVASLLDYMQREGIERPEGAATRRFEIPVAKKEFSFNPPPSKLLVKAFIKANIYDIDDLKKNFKNLLKSSYFGNKRVNELINYMKQLGINEIPEVLQTKYQASIENLFASIKDEVDVLVENKHLKFIYPYNAAISIAFAKLHITNMRSLQKKLNDLQDTLRNKLVAITELRDWIIDTKEYYSKNSENKTNTITLYLDGLRTIFPNERIKSLRFSKKVASYLTGKNVPGMPRVDGQAIVQLSNLKLQIDKNQFLSEAEVLRLFGVNPKEASAEEKNITHLLCRSAGFKVRDLRRFGQKKGIDVFVTKDSATAHILQDLIAISYEQLQTLIIPINASALAKNIRKNYTKKFNDEMLAHLLCSLSFVEKNGNDFSIPANKLKSKSDIAERILFISNRKLTTDELCTKVNKVLRLKGKPTSSENQRSATLFLKNENIAFNTKTGEWSYKKPSNM